MTLHLLFPIKHKNIFNFAEEVLSLLLFLHTIFIKLHKGVLSALVDIRSDADAQADDLFEHIQIFLSQELEVVVDLADIFNNKAVQPAEDHHILKRNQLLRCSFFSYFHLSLFRRLANRSSLHEYPLQYFYEVNLVLLCQLR